MQCKARRYDYKKDALYKCIFFHFYYLLQNYADTALPSDPITYPSGVVPPICKEPSGLK